MLLPRIRRDHLVHHERRELYEEDHHITVIVPSKPQHENPHPVPHALLLPLKPERDRFEELLLRLENEVNEMKQKEQEMDNEMNEVQREVKKVAKEIEELHENHRNRDEKYQEDADEHSKYMEKLEERMSELKAENKELGDKLDWLKNTTTETFDVLAAGDKVGYSYIKIRNLVYKAREEIVEILQLDKHNSNPLDAFRAEFYSGPLVQRIQVLQSKLEPFRNLHPSIQPLLDQKTLGILVDTNNDLQVKANRIAHDVYRLGWYRAAIDTPVFADKRSTLTTILNFVAAMNPMPNQ
ncbi:hypothetical protein E1B28_009228 [Marasmius oreades]|uniref:Uncharacterized protein n=1 Tax=Marasmius oreades TaxID=181124 RepID=A0A9P7S1N3_9AGAR|nr:uncharacterized protein E1B28_009228 [Marasmius oreades]KAG7092923.1 hypothetical protein E1B28_009228 [Marasmius oreades]